MSIKLSVGLSKKVGQPDYGSLGASCHVELELDSALLQGDLDGFQEKARRAFVSCAQAVNDEIERQRVKRKPQDDVGGHNYSTNGHNGHANGKNGNGQRTRPATTSQVRAIEAIAERQGINLERLLHERFGVSRPADLSIGDASALIDELKSQVNGGRT